MAEVLSPGYLRCLAGYTRAHAAYLDACALGDAGRAEARRCLADRQEWQRLMQSQARFVRVRDA